MCLQVEYKYLKSSFPYITSLSIPKLKHPPQALHGGKEKKRRRRCGLENEPANVCMLANATQWRSIKRSGSLCVIYTRYEVL